MLVITFFYEKKKKHLIIEKTIYTFFMKPLLIHCCLKYLLKFVFLKKNDFKKYFNCYR